MEAHSFRGSIEWQQRWRTYNYVKRDKTVSSRDATPEGGGGPGFLLYGGRAGQKVARARAWAASDGATAVHGAAPPALTCDVQRLKKGAASVYAAVWGHRKTAHATT